MPRFGYREALDACPVVLRGPGKRGILSQEVFVMGKKVEGREDGEAEREG